MTAPTAPAPLAWLGQQGFTPMVTAQVPTAPGGRFAKDQFRVDLAAGAVTCPARVTVAIRPGRRGGGRARFGVACSVCPLRQACTTSIRGRVVAVGPREAELAAAVNLARFAALGLRWTPTGWQVQPA